MRALPLSSLHRAGGASLAEVDGVERVETYGDPNALARSARADAGLLDLSHRGRLAVVGPDRESWLQGMVTADIKKLEVGAGCAATVVTVKGKLVAALRVFKRPDELSDRPRSGARDPCIGTLTPLHRHGGVRDRRPQRRNGHDWSPRPASGGSAGDGGRCAEYRQAKLQVGGQEVLAIGSVELGLEGFDLWLAPDAGADVWRTLLAAGAVPLGLDAAEILRIEAGRPRFGAELDEDTLPLEAGLERAISYDKGCYVGQEVIARITHRGHVNRKLAGLWISGSTPVTAGAALTQEGKPAGVVRSSLISERLGSPIALAYVRRESLAPGTVLGLADGRTATVTALPFEKRS